MLKATAFGALAEMLIGCVAMIGGHVRLGSSVTAAKISSSIGNPTELFAREMRTPLLLRMTDLGHSGFWASRIVTC